jgi:hypothetical protein
MSSTSRNKRRVATNPKDGNNKENTEAEGRREMNSKLLTMNDRLDELVSKIEDIQKNVTEDKVRELIAAAMADQAPQEPTEAQGTKSTGGYSSISQLENSDRVRMVVEL